TVLRSAHPCSHTVLSLPVLSTLSLHDALPILIAIIKNIPEGRVMTYGQIARLAGTPRGARQVARILHSMSRKHHLPWHRVINVQGKLTIKDEALYLEQKMSLEIGRAHV